MGTIGFRVLGSWVKGGTTHNNGDSEGKRTWTIEWKL